jgi:hypothetical protein
MHKYFKYFENIPLTITKLKYFTYMSFYTSVYTSRWFIYLFLVKKYILFIVKYV